MADERMKLTLREPAEKPFLRDGEDAILWNFTTTDGKAKYVSFDPKLIEAFTAKGCAGVEHEYVIRPDKQGRSPMVVGIAGIFEPPAKKGGGGGGGGRPLLSDRQAALFAAVAWDPGQPANLLQTADTFARWLAGGSALGPTKESTRRVAAPPAPARETEAPATELPDEGPEPPWPRSREVINAELAELLPRMFPVERARTDWITARLAKYGATRGAELSVEQLEEVVADLKRIGAGR